MIVLLLGALASAQVPPSPPSDEAASESEAGVEEEFEEGIEGGVIGGVLTSEIGATLPPPAERFPFGHKVRHHTTLRFKKPPRIRYPASMRGKTSEDVRCIAQVVIDHRGRPTWVGTVDCPEAFSEAVEESVLDTRWHPPADVPNGESVAFTYRFVFKPS